MLDVMCPAVEDEEGLNKLQPGDVIATEYDGDSMCRKNVAVWHIRTAVWPETDLTWYVVTPDLDENSEDLFGGNLVSGPRSTVRLPNGGGLVHSEGVVCAASENIQMLRASEMWRVDTVERDLGTRSADWKPMMKEADVDGWMIEGLNMEDGLEYWNDVVRASCLQLLRWVWYVGSCKKSLLAVAVR